MNSANEGMPHTTKAKPPFDRIAGHEAEHRALMHLIARFAVLISVSYGILYVALGFELLALKTGILSMVYLAVLWASKRPKVPVRPLSIAFMFVALLHTVTLGLLFLPTATGAIHPPQSTALWGGLFFWVVEVPEARSLSGPSLGHEGPPHPDARFLDYPLHCSLSMSLSVRRSMSARVTSESSSLIL